MFLTIHLSVREYIQIILNNNLLLWQFVIHNGKVKFGGKIADWLLHGYEYMLDAITFLFEEYDHHGLHTLVWGSWVWFMDQIYIRCLSQLSTFSQAYNPYTMGRG